MLCEFFGCDANYLFGTDYIDPNDGPNQSTSKADKYILDTYGLDRITLEFFKKFKDCGIDSVDDSDVPHLASSNEKSFSSLFNELIHQAPWTISALLQLIYANKLDLSSYGFADIYEIAKHYPDFPGIPGYLVKDFDSDVALSVFCYSN